MYADLVRLKWHATRKVVYGNYSLKRDRFEACSSRGHAYLSHMLEAFEIEKMSLPERLRAMEQLWDAVWRQPGDVASPEWHRDILKDRKTRAERGESRFLTLSEL